MLFPDWVAITVLVLLLVGAASAWIRQHKSALTQQTKKPRFSKRTEESRDWSYTKERIGLQLKAHYQALATEELPPRLLALLKKFDEETERSAS
jgi:hypothetical protein